MRRRTKAIYASGSLRRRATAALLGVALLFAGCTKTTITAQPAPPVAAAATWVLLPIANYSATPLAGVRAESILATVLRVGGVPNLRDYPTWEMAGQLPVLSEGERYERALEWANEQGLMIGVTGSVEEWRYKNGIAREPAVAVSVQLVDIATAQVLWSASAARAGSSRGTVSGTAQTLLTDIVAAMNLGTKRD